MSPRLPDLPGGSIVKMPNPYGARVARTELTERAICDANGWVVGTMLRGREQWGANSAVWTTILITAIGESNLLARCVRHEREVLGVLDEPEDCFHYEKPWTLKERDWEEVERP